MRARTVLLVVVQTLAAYRLGKADKFGQLFQDATSRQQISFQNLAISIEEDKLYKYELPACALLLNFSAELTYHCV